MNKFIILIAILFLTSCASQSSQPYSVIKFDRVDSSDKNNVAVSIRRIDGSVKFEQNNRWFRENRVVVEPGERVLELRQRYSKTNANTLISRRSKQKRTLLLDAKPCIRYFITGQLLSDGRLKPDWQPRIIMEEPIKHCESLVNEQDKKNTKDKS